MALTLRGVPNHLYKYFSPERPDTLKSRLLKFTPLGQFNDPFEGRPNFQGFATEATTRRLFEEHLPTEMEQSYGRLPPELREVLSKDAYFEHALPAMRERFPELFQSLEETAKRVIGDMAAQLDQHIGALCLSEVPDSLLMWAHYGQSHMGFALEFDAHHPYFHQQTSERDELRHIRRVLYRDSRPTGAMTDLDGSAVFLTKSIHWLYEREWRMFMPLKSATTVAQTPAGPVYLYQVPPEAISGVILGARCSSVLQGTISKLIDTQPELAHVKIRRCSPDRAEFVLRVSEDVQVN